MATSKIMDSYDDTKKMLNTIRRIQATVKPKYGLIQEQIDDSSVDQSTQGTEGMQDSTPASLQNPKQGGDLAVINDVEIQIHSDDPEDLELTPEEKGKISQLIDDFRAEVSETVEFGTMNIYATSAKLDGRITDIALEFTLSTGDDTGLYIKGAMLKIDDNSLEAINKLKVFEAKYANIINTLLVNRNAG
jgi:sporulation protein YlmC with PRC-barrel domain